MSSTKPRIGFGTEPFGLLPFGDPTRPLSIGQVKDVNFYEEDIQPITISQHCDTQVQYPR